MNNLKEEIFFFPGPKRRNLLGFLHNSNDSSASIGVIYCHPFAEEKNMSHSVIVKTARMIASEGFPVFRFDLSGCGDSEGEFGSFSLNDWQDDLSAAIDFFQNKTGIKYFILWGLRLGGGQMLLWEKHHNKANGLLLWHPVLDFGLHLQQFLRRTLSSEITRGDNHEKSGRDVFTEIKQNNIVHVIGYPITNVLYESFNAVNKNFDELSKSIPVLVLSISLMDISPFYILQFSDSLCEKSTSVTLHHIVEEPFWDRYWKWDCTKANKLTIQWLKELSNIF